MSILSCRKNELAKNTDIEDRHFYLETSNFAVALAKTLKNEPLVRDLIKAESLRQIDKDYDVLFVLVKDKLLDDGETLRQKIDRYAQDMDLDGFLNKNPLLTIYVPELPEFNAEIWDTKLQIPEVAVEPDNIQSLMRKVEVYDSEGIKNELDFSLVPGTPTIVVKKNERIIIYEEETAKSSEKILKESDFPVPFSQIGTTTFAFASPDFNNLAAQTNRPASSSDIDPVNIAAFNSGNEWQRDYVYYGITPTNQTGLFTNRYSEFVVSMKFLNPNDYYLVSDQQNDPKLDDGWIISFSGYPQPKWIEGNFEFRMSVLINAKNGVGQELKKVFTAKGSDLFTPVYKKLLHPHYKLESITAKEFRPVSLELIPWDLEQYGLAWKFIVSEFDPSEEVTYSVTNTSVFGGNFSFDPVFSGTVKGGAKFGASVQTTHSTTYTYKTTTGSDELGEGILEFRSPIIVSQTGTIYNTYEVNTGVLSLSVEPKKIF